MTQTRKKYLKISKGQIAKNLIERSDIGILDDSGQTITNFYNSKYGALKTVSGTIKTHSWDGKYKVSLAKILLPNNKEAIVVFDGTNHAMRLFNHNGLPLTENVSCQYITENNVKNIQVAQQNDLYLLCTGDCPLIKLTITTSSLSWKIYSIPANKIIKSKAEITISYDPNYYQVRELSNEVIDFPVLVNPNLTPPTGEITLYNLEIEEDQSKWKITHAIISSIPASKYKVNTYTIDDAGTGYAVDDTISVNSVLFTITEYTPTTVTIEPVNPDEEYPADIAGTFTATGGTGTGMQITLTSTELQYQVGDEVVVKGSVFRITTLAVGETLEKISDQYFEENPAELNVEAEGGSYTGLLVDVDGDYQHREYSAYTRVVNESDVIRDVSNNNVWVYSNGSWIKPNLSGTAQTITYGYKVSNIQSGAKSTMTFGYLKENKIGIWTISKSWVASPTYIGISANSWDQALNRFRQNMIGAIVEDLSANMGMIKVTEVSIATGYIYNGIYYVAVWAVAGINLVGFVTGDWGWRNVKFHFEYQPAFSGDLPNTNGNPFAATNYPTSILFYQQRLFIGGTEYNRQQIIASKLGEYDNFSAEENNTRDAFQLVLGSNKKENISHLFLNQGMQIFCEDSEWIIDGQTISSTSGFVKNSDIGCSKVKPELSANGITLFVPKNGKGLIAFTYNYQQANYSTPYISLFTDLLNNEIEHLCLKKGADSNEDTLLLLCLQNGDLVIGNYLVEHEIQAFCLRREENTQFLQTAECEGNVLMLTNRNNYTTLEKLSNEAYTSLETRIFTYSSKTITTTDPRFFNQVINTYDNDKKFIEKVEISNSGVGTLKSDTTPVYIGLNIPTIFESNPLNYGTQTYNSYKNIAQIKLVLPKESDVEHNKKIKINKKPPRVKDNFLEYYRVARPQRDCRFELKSEIYPCEILSMEVDLEI